MMDSDNLLSAPKGQGVWPGDRGDGPRLAPSFLVYFSFFIGFEGGGAKNPGLLPSEFRFRIDMQMHPSLNFDV
jgi:hypothetical protein